MSASELEAAQADVKRLTRELREAQLRMVQMAKQNSLERLALAVAHEVRNPLATLQMGLDYFSRREAVPDEELRILRSMQSAVERTNRVVVEFVEMTRIKEIDFRLENLNLVVRRALNQVEPDLRASDLHVDLHLSEGLPMLRLDALKMEQVLVNLLANAIEASPVCGRIEVRTGMMERERLSGAEEVQATPEGNVYVVEVRDWGTGIPHPYLAKIFNPFFTTKKKGGFSGLGLFAARAIVGIHEGVLTVENRDSEGVSARVVLPGA